MLYHVSIECMLKTYYFEIKNPANLHLSVIVRQLFGTDTYTEIHAFILLVVKCWRSILSIEFIEPNLF